MKTTGIRQEMTIKTILFCLLCCIYPLGGVGAQSRAFDKGDYAGALDELLPMAKQGNAEAQCELGIMYANGKGVPQDYTEAIKWYRLAADQGYSTAQFSLG